MRFTGSVATSSTGERLRRALNLPAIVTIAAGLLAWETSVRSGLVAFEYLPAPSAVGRGLWHLARSGALFTDLAHTVRAVLLGWGIATVAGVAAGLLLGFSAGARRYSLATVDALRPIPGVALVPAGVLVFGFSLQMELLVIVYPSLWPVLVNTMGGVTNVSGRLREVAQTLRLSRMATIRKILLPAAAPPILVGCRLSMGVALVMAVIAEMVGNPQGLGYAIVREQQALQPARMFAYVISVGLLGLALNGMVLGAGRVAFPGWTARLRQTGP